LTNGQKAASDKVLNYRAEPCGLKPFIFLCPFAYIIYVPKKNKKYANAQHLINKILDLDEVNEKMSKNEVNYRCQERKKKIKRIIAFSIFCALVLSVYLFAIIVSQTASYPYPAVVRFVRESILRNNGHPALQTVIFISLAFIAIKILEFIIHFFARAKSKQSKTIAVLISHSVRYIGVVIVFILVFNAWEIDPAIMAAILAAVGIAIGLGAQGVISDLITGLSLIFERSLQVGDIISFNDFIGEVKDIGFRTTKIRSLKGEVKVINNSQLRAFINLTMHLSSAFCDINIEYGANLKFVEETINEHLPIIADKYPVISEGPIYRGVQEFNDKGVMLRVVAKCHESERFQLQRDLNREFKILFDKHNIRIAVPKVELVENQHTDNSNKKTTT